MLDAGRNAHPSISRRRLTTGDELHVIVRLMEGDGEDRNGEEDENRDGENRDMKLLQSKSIRLRLI